VVSDVTDSHLESRLNEREVPQLGFVDTHCHASLRWFEPVDTLLFEMDRCGVEKAVLIGNLYEPDQDYQQACFHQHPDRFASVVLVDPQRPDAVGLLERFVDDGATGVRLRANERSPDEDPLAIWRAASRLQLPVSCLGNGRAFADDAFSELVEELPELVIVLEHLGGITAAHSDTDREKVWALARFPNLYIKIPPLSKFVERDLPYKSSYPFKRPTPPYLQEAYDRFGPERMMWSSNFPPVAGCEGYRNSLLYPLDEFASTPLADREMMFGGTARRVFRFSV
jgi:L-fuconolactonase